MPKMIRKSLDTPEESEAVHGRQRKGGPGQSRLGCRRESDVRARMEMVVAREADRENQRAARLPTSATTCPVEWPFAWMTVRSWSSDPATSRSFRRVTMRGSSETSLAW